MSKVDKWTGLPSELPDGQIMVHMSARMRRTYADIAFQELGGVERLVAWADKNDDNYGTFITRVWAPGQAKHTSAEVNLGENVEDLLRRLDGGESARVISPDDPEDS